MSQAENLNEIENNLQTNNKNLPKESTTDESLNNLNTADSKMASLTIYPPYLPWNDYFMSLCYLTAARSKDPRTRVGACIVDKDNRVISLGYNGMPRGISDEDLPWEKEAAHSYETKYPYVCHAEMNAVLNEKHCAVDGCCIYTTKFPCCECAKIIIQAGIVKVIYGDSKPQPCEEEIPSRRMFLLAGVDCKKFVPTIPHMSLNIINGKGSVSVGRKAEI